MPRRGDEQGHCLFLYDCSTRRSIEQVSIPSAQVDARLSDDRGPSHAEGERQAARHRQRAVEVVGVRAGRRGGRRSSFRPTPPLRLAIAIVDMVAPSVTRSYLEKRGAYGRSNTRFRVGSFWALPATSRWCSRTLPAGQR